jgi:hypothetical protein
MLSMKIKVLQRPSRDSQEQGTLQILHDSEDDTNIMLHVRTTNY